MFDNDWHICFRGGHKFFFLQFHNFGGAPLFLFQVHLHTPHFDKTTQRNTSLGWKEKDKKTKKKEVLFRFYLLKCF